MTAVTLRLALRHLLRSPGFTVVAFGSLAVGIGASPSMPTISSPRPLPGTPKSGACAAHRTGKRGHTRPQDCNAYAFCRTT